VTWWRTHPGPDGTINTNAHRRAILDANLTDIGVGFAAGSASSVGPGGTFVVDFGMCMNW